MTIRGGFMTRLQGQEEPFRLSDLDRQALGMLWKYVRMHKGRLALALAATLTVTASTLAMPYLTKVAVDTHIARRDVRGLALVCFVARDGNNRLYAISSDGSDSDAPVLVMLGCPQQSAASRPAVSPDERWVAVSLDDELWLASVDGIEAAEPRLLAIAEADTRVDRVWWAGERVVFGQLGPEPNQRKLFSVLFQEPPRKLRAQFGLFSFDILLFEVGFSKAQRIADEHGLHLLARTISIEHDKLLEQLEKWEDLRKIKAPVSERLKYVEIDKTLNHMMGKQMMEPPELIEEVPILLLIMDDAGHSCFNHTFIKDWDFSTLFSSFMSAFNTFSSEIFSRTIDRIKIGENIIFIKPVEPFLACYVSKGQSYPAIKKLNKFSDTIKNKSEIWKRLNRAAEASQELNVSNLPLLGTVVNEIFAQ